MERLTNCLIWCCKLSRHPIQNSCIGKKTYVTGEPLENIGSIDCTLIFGTQKISHGVHIVRNINILHRCYYRMGFHCKDFCGYFIMYGETYPFVKSIFSVIIFSSVIAHVWHTISAKKVQTPKFCVVLDGHCRLCEPLSNQELGVAVAPEAYQGLKTG